MWEEEVSFSIFREYLRITRWERKIKLNWNWIRKRDELELEILEFAARKSHRSCRLGPHRTNTICHEFEFPQWNSQIQIIQSSNTFLQIPMTRFNLILKFTPKRTMPSSLKFPSNNPSTCFDKPKKTTPSSSKFPSNNPPTHFDNLPTHFDKAQWLDLI